MSNDNLILSSPAFNNNDTIPSKYTWDGADVSPELNWENIPTATKSLALIVDDPDAPGGTWTHWILYNIPSNIKKLPENITHLPSGAEVGINSWKTKEYGGPCPPSGEHRYFFK